MSAAEQLDFETLPLPAAFIARWRDLEDFHGIARAGLTAVEVIQRGNGRVWIVLKVDGRHWCLLDQMSPEKAAEELWRRTGRAR
jgi:hypothetical protein